MKSHHNTFPSLPCVSFLIPCLVPLLFWMNRNMRGCMCMLSCVWIYETPMDYSPPGPSVHGIFQARILEWAAIPFSRGYSPHRDRTHVLWVSCIGRWILYHWATETSRQLPYMSIITESDIIQLSFVGKPVHDVFLPDINTKLLFCIINCQMKSIMIWHQENGILEELMPKYFGHLIQRPDSLEKDPDAEKDWRQEEKDDRGWDGWMASLTRWMWVWARSGSWWWTGMPGVLQSMGLRRVGYNWVTEPNWNGICDGEVIHLFKCHRLMRKEVNDRHAHRKKSYILWYSI